MVPLDHSKIICYGEWKEEPGICQLLDSERKREKKYKKKLLNVAPSVFQYSEIITLRR
jgi:hypothetical protein